MTILLLLIASLVLLVLASAFCSSSEVAYFSLDHQQISRIKEGHEASGRRIEALLAMPTKLLSSILIGNTVVNIALTSISYLLFERLLPGHSDGLVILLATALVLVFGEFLPKRLALQYPERTAILYAPLLESMTRLLTPFRIGLERITHTFSEWFQPRGRRITADEAQSLVDHSGESGILDEHEHTMVRAIIQLEKLYAADIMTPRVDMIGYDLDDGPKGLYEMVRRLKVRQVVLYRDQLDQIEGFLDVRHFLLDPKHRLENAIRPAFFIPEQATLDKLLTHFVAETRRMAVVVDEYGGTAGLITRGDILEEIVGDLADEFHQSQVFEELTPTAWMIDGNMSIEEVNQLLNLNLQANGSYRLAGWYTSQTESLPSPKEMVQGDGFSAMVWEMRRNRITLVVLEKDPEGAGK
jgi:putative hemolysin